MAPERVKLGPGPGHLVARIPTGSGHSVVAAGLRFLRACWFGLFPCLLSFSCKPGGFQHTEICSSLLGLKVRHQAWLTSCFPGVLPLPQELPPWGRPQPLPHHGKENSTGL